MIRTKKAQATFMPFVTIATIVVLGWITFGLAESNQTIGASQQLVFDSLHLVNSEETFLNTSFENIMKLSLKEFANNGGEITNQLSNNQKIKVNGQDIPYWFNREIDRNICQEDTIITKNSNVVNNYEHYFRNSFNTYSEIPGEAISQYIPGSYFSTHNLNNLDTGIQDFIEVSGTITSQTLLERSRSQASRVITQTFENDFNSILEYPLTTKLSQIKQNVKTEYNRIYQELNDEEFPETRTFSLLEGTEISKSQKSCTPRINKQCSTDKSAAIYTSPRSNCLREEIVIQRAEEECLRSTSYDEEVEERCEKDFGKAFCALTTPPTKITKEGILEDIKEEHQECIDTQQSEIRNSCSCTSDNECATSATGSKCYRGKCRAFERQENLPGEKRYNYVEYEGAFKLVDETLPIPVEYTFALKWVKSDPEYTCENPVRPQGVRNCRPSSNGYVCDNT